MLLVVTRALEPRAPVFGSPGTSSVGTITTSPCAGVAVASTRTAIVAGGSTAAAVGLEVGVGGTPACVGVGTGGWVGAGALVPAAPAVTVTTGAMMAVAVPGAE